MVRGEPAADVLVPYHTYPHTDQHGTGVRAAWAMARLLAGGVVPTTAAVRLPFYRAMDGDEFYLSVIAAQWLDGNLPYVATFDIKPPGLYFILLVGQALFGNYYVTIKGTEIVAVTLGAWGLYEMLRGHGTQRVAAWVAILYPVFTLALGGIVAIAMLVQLPFFIFAFSAARSYSTGSTQT